MDRTNSAIALLWLVQGQCTPKSYDPTKFRGVCIYVLLINTLTQHACELTILLGADATLWHSRQHVDRDNATTTGTR